VIALDTSPSDLIPRLLPFAAQPVELHHQAYAVVLYALGPEPFPSKVQWQPTALNLQTTI
jgi:hypothetical protein